MIDPVGIIRRPAFTPIPKLQAFRKKGRGYISNFGGRISNGYSERTFSKSLDSAPPHYDPRKDRKKDFTVGGERELV